MDMRIVKTIRKSEFQHWTRVDNTECVKLKYNMDITLHPTTKDLINCTRDEAVGETKQRLIRYVIH